MFTPNFIQQEYINQIHKLFDEGSLSKSDKNLPTIVYLLNRVRPIAPAPLDFFEFWFHRCLSESNRTYLSALNPKYDSTWGIDPKQKANYIESFLNLLIAQGEMENMKEILNQSLEFGIIIEPIFIKNIPETIHFTANEKKIAIKRAEKNTDELLTKGTKKSTY